MLDISIELQNDEILTKYDIPSGHAILAEEKHLPLYDEIWKMEGREAIPGGSGLNSARAVNFVLKNQGHEGSVTYIGSLGNDEKGEVL